MGTLNSTIEELMCCSGFCIDLLAKFGEELQFEYDLIRVTDPKWGVLKVRFFFFLTRKVAFSGTNPVFHDQSLCNWKRKQD
jgi:hypothetical protein